MRATEIKRLFEVADIHGLLQTKQKKGNLEKAGLLPSGSAPHVNDGKRKTWREGEVGAGKRKGPWVALMLNPCHSLLVGALGRLCSTGHYSSLLHPRDQHRSLPLPSLGPHPPLGTLSWFLAHPTSSSPSLTRTFVMVKNQSSTLPNPRKSTHRHGCHEHIFVDEAHFFLGSPVPPNPITVCAGFSSTPLKLERREDPHGPCARMTGISVNVPYLKKKKKIPVLVLSLPLLNIPLLY